MDTDGKKEELRDAGGSSVRPADGSIPTETALRGEVHRYAVWQRYAALRRRFFSLCTDEQSGVGLAGCLHALRQLAPALGGEVPPISVPELPMTLYFPAGGTGREERGSVLLLCPELSVSEASGFAVRAALAFAGDGWFVTVGAVRDGSLRGTLLSHGIPVAVSSAFTQTEPFFKFGGDGRPGAPVSLTARFDLVVACTAELSGPALHASGRGTPIIWWLNDGLMEIRRLASALPPQRPADITVCGSWPGVGGAFEKCGLRWDVMSMPACVPERHGDEKPAARTSGGPVAFLAYGDICPRGGQHLLAEAIRQLPVEDLLKSQFYFAGTETDGVYARRLRDFCRAWPNAEYADAASDEALELLVRRTDVLVFPGGGDPRTCGPADGLMLGRACLCADTSAAAGLLHDETDGLIFPAGNAAALGECLCMAIDRGGFTKEAAARSACARLPDEASFGESLLALARRLVPRERRTVFSSDMLERELDEWLI